ncbi:GAF domain-containing protein [Proteiniphilum sp. X52]|uniref:GAF domain-containing protein n=1 Tax=Proteiniphilum sp. X52 TaxID=2382159 RepID=UPI000F0A4D37|nr:GAF domain-containing protein [Proteiniphilum sp. X52]RNC64638.1 GAF domain-containing protein [Proteiniphilum sp. X52]
MAEDLHIPYGVSKEGIYKALYPQLQALVEGEPDLIANMANITSVLKEAFRFLWVGFYRVWGEQLVLGPFQGPPACTRINYGKGVCGTAWKEERTLIVPDVDKFPGHIACSRWSRSEIVVPVRQGGAVTAVLDVDSDRLGHFDETDAFYLGEIIELFR